MALAPVEILFSFVSGYLSSSRPFLFSFRLHILCGALSTYTVLVLFEFFPSDIGEVESTKTIMHVTIVALLTTLAHSCLDTGQFSLIF